jgi:hypothetical protein
MRAAAAVLVLVLTACYTTPPGVNAVPSSSATPPPNPAPGVITWPAISSSDTDSFGIDIAGTGTGVSKVDIRNRFGTVTLEGRSVSTLVYKGIPWSSYALVLYQALAVEAHSWTVFWFYCRDQTLTYVYWESTSRSKLFGEPMKGSCKSASSGQTTVTWPAGSMSPPALVKGFIVHGATIEISGAAAGHTLLTNKTWLVFPFTVVDCSKSCGTPGWYELHSILWESETGEIAYGIFYLTTGHPHQVQLDYTLELPSLERLDSALYEADWSRA